MHGRINKRFLIILIVVVSVLVGSLGGVWAVFRKTVDDHIVLGDEYVAKKKWYLAASEYGKAVNKADSPGADLLVKLYDVRSQIKVPYGAEARTAYARLHGLIERATREDPSNADAFSRLMKIYMTLGEHLDHLAVWAEMGNAASHTLEVSPTMREAGKYRGIAQVNRLRRGLNLNNEERARAKIDLDAYRALHPDDSDCTYHLAIWYVEESKRMEQQDRAADKQQVVLLRRTAQDFAQESAENAPDDIGRQLDYIQIVLMCHELEKGKKARQLMQKARLAVNDIEARLLVTPGSRRDYLRMWRLIAATDVTADKTKQLSETDAVVFLQRIRRLLAVASKAHKKDLLLKLSYARTVSASDDDDANEQAMALFREIRETKIKAIPIEAFIQTTAQNRAVLGEVSLRLKLASTTSDADARQGDLDECNRLLEDARGTLGSADPEHYLLLGKLRALQNRWVEAVVALDEADKLYSRPKAEVMIMRATALARMGQGGRAMEIYKKILSIDYWPDKKPIYERLIRLAIRHKQFNVADQYVKDFRKQYPDEKLVLQLALEMAKAQNDTDKVADLLVEVRMLEGVAPGSADHFQAESLIWAGKKQEARQLLEQRLAKSPDDQKAIQLLMNTTDDKQILIEYVAKARQAGAKGVWLDGIEGILSGEITQLEFLLRRIELLPDTTDANKLLRYNFKYGTLLRFGKTDEAADLLEKVEQSYPGAQWVVDVQFDEALQERDWEFARILASRAETANFDHAGGAFYYGRIAVARQRFNEAITSFTSGLKRYNQESQYWSMLGDAQRGALLWSNAIESYEESLELKPDNIRALEGLAVAHEKLDQRDEALNYLAKAVEYQPENAKIRNFYLRYLSKYGNKDEAMRQRRELAVSHPQDANNRRHLAYMLADEDKHTEAREVIDQLIADGDDQLSNMIVSAEITRRAGRKMEARQILEDYIKRRGDDKTADDLIALARMLLKIGLPEDSMQAYVEAAKMEDPTKMAATRELALQLDKRGKYGYAAQLYEDLAKALPEDKAVGYRCVELMVYTGQVVKADKFLVQLIDQFGHDDSTYILGAMVATEMGDAPRALEALDKAENLNPQRAMIYFIRARILSMIRGREEEARQQASRALERDPNMSDARLLMARLLVRMGDMSSAKSELISIINDDRKSGDARYDLAVLYNTAGESKKARVLLTKSQNLFPSEVRWPRMLAYIARIEQKPRIACNYLERVFEIEPNHMNLIDLATTHIEAKQPAKAIALFVENEGMTKQNPVYMYSVRGWSYAAQGNNDQANDQYLLALATCKNIKDFQVVNGHMVRGIGRSRTQAILAQILSDQNSVPVNLMLAQYENDDRDFEQVKKRLGTIDDQVPVKEPTRALFDYLLATAQFQTGDYEAARQSYERLLDWNMPNKVEILNNLAYILNDQLADPDKALPHATQAAELAPDNPMILDTLGWIYFQKGSNKQAIDTLRSSVELMKIPDNCLHLAEALLKQNEQGDEDEALQLLKESMRLLAYSPNEEISDKVQKHLRKLEK